MSNAFAHKRWRSFGLAAAVLSTVSAHVMSLGYKKLVDVDEGYSLAIAERLLEGFKLYDGAVSQRGPLMYYTYAAIAATTGWDNLIGLRCWALAFSVGNVLMVYWAGARLFSRATGVVAALLMAYALAFGMPARDAVALHGETIQLPLLIASVMTGAAAMRRRSRARTRLLFVSGLSMGAAICVKHSLAVHPLPLLVWIVFDSHKKRTPAPATLQKIAVFIGGVLLAPAAFVAHAAANGTLRSLYEYAVAYNLGVHLHPASKMAELNVVFDKLNERTLFFIATLFVAVQWAPVAMRRVAAAWRAKSAWSLGTAFGVHAYIALHFAVALVTASSMSRFFPHYFIQTLPFLTLLLATSIGRTLASSKWGHAARRVVTAFACFLVAYGVAFAYYAEKFDGRSGHDALVERLAKYIEASTAPDQRIFVWGFSPWLYPYSHRRPAGRFVFETYVTGFVPWFWEDLEKEPSRVVPGSMDQLLSDLDRETPAVVVDAGAVLFARPMRAYDKPAEWLHEHYCFALRFGAYDVYRRKTDPSCPVAAFPRSPFPVDFYGNPLAILMPRLVDEQRSRMLRSNEPDKAVWFSDEPTPEFADVLRDFRREREIREARDKLGLGSIDVLTPSPCQSDNADDR